MRDQQHHDQIQSPADAMIDRLVDDPASADWAGFCALADADPALWRRLAESQRQEALLRSAVDDALRIADSVELPGIAVSADTADAAPRRGSPGVHRRRIGARGFAWAGWAAAAVIALAWLMPFAPPHPAGGMADGSAVIPAGYVRLDSTDDALDAYLAWGRAEGRVVGEAGAPVLLDVLPVSMVDNGSAGESYVVLLERRFVERVEVPALYGMGRDETGEVILRELGVQPAELRESPARF